MGYGADALRAGRDRPALTGTPRVLVRGWRLGAYSEGVPIVSSVIDRVATVGGDAAERFLSPSGFDAPRFFAEVFDDLRREPSYALETIALRAVEVHGAAAKAWLADTSTINYSPDQLAKIAVKRSTNLARLEGGTLGFGGFTTIAPDLAALIFILTREVIFVSAAYGQDPTHPDRAASCSWSPRSTAPSRRRRPPSIAVVSGSPSRSRRSRSRTSSAARASDSAPSASG